MVKAKGLQGLGMQPLDFDLGGQAQSLLRHFLHSLSIVFILGEAQHLSGLQKAAVPNFRPDDRCFGIGKKVEKLRTHHTGHASIPAGQRPVLLIQVDNYQQSFACRLMVPEKRNIIAGAFLDHFQFRFSVKGRVHFQQII